MIEIFKTNIRNADQANMLVELIHNTFGGYKANVDLHDCDRILRIQHAGGMVNAASVITLLHHAGFYAEVLPDEFLPADSSLHPSGLSEYINNLS